MRRLAALVMSLGAFVAFSVQADAAPRKPAKKKVVAKTVPVANGRTPSLYAGIHGGFGSARHRSPEDAQNLTARGALGGVQLGANYQFDRFVAGVEGDVSGAGLKRSIAGDLGGTPITGSVKHSMFATLALRLGLAHGRTLVYAKGGGAWTRYKWNFDAPGVGTASSSNMRGGWMLGAGLEQALTETVSARVEYNYMDFGTRTETLTTTGGLGAAPAPVELDAHLVKFGVNYRFTPAR